MKIDTHDTTVGQLLKDFLVIPRFQRPYDWGREQVEQLWTDAVVDKGDAGYFIGSIVLYKHGDALGIVDGQQRITTVLLGLCAIRDAFVAAGHKNLADALQEKVERNDIDSKKRFVLHTETSSPFLQDRYLSSQSPKLAIDPSTEETHLTHPLIS